MADFHAAAFGKWILAGEHAVIRGKPALVFPLRSRFLELSYRDSGEPLSLELEGAHGRELQVLVWGVLEKACALKNIPREKLHGHLHLSSSLPVGAGMGASASLCVVLTRWLGHLGFVNEEEYYEFARSLENIFHGESSGVDIAVALSGEALTFVRGQKFETFCPHWQPRWYISYSGERGVTIDCVNKVKALIVQDPTRGAALDEQMAEAVGLCRQALSTSEQEGRALLVRGLEVAADCFAQWGLSEGAPTRHMQKLREAGALAVKPTGSGGGGYVLSLWEKEPPKELQGELIACL